MKTYQNQFAYISATGSFLPGPAIDNDQMEEVLGLVDGKKSRLRRKILSSNGIQSRHYAIDNRGNPSHMTDQLASEAIKSALIDRQVEQDTLDMISVGTTLPDLLAPGIASMVHGLVGGKNADILSCSGICGAGAAAFKAAAMSVISGQHNRVVACGTERPSVIMRGHRFKKESEIKREVEDDRIGESYKYFNADFLRWMLSDGAGAFIIDNQPNPEKLSLKIEWVETASYAHELPTCMYMGTSNPGNPEIKNTWLHQQTHGELEDLGLLLLRQDVTLLAENIVDIVSDYARELKERDYFSDTSIDWFLPHISSYFFHERLQQKFSEVGLDIPADRWFTNLRNKGNTGAASIYIMLDELFHSGKLKDGERILLMVPESGRFSVSYALLTVVKPN